MHFGAGAPPDSVGLEPSLTGCTARPDPRHPRGRAQHGGFRPLADAVSPRGAPPSERNVRLLWAGGLVAFTLSAALDNLTTTIVMLSVLQARAHAREPPLSARALLAL
jgi:hypothetical protein